MSVITLLSARSYGTSTTALALAFTWPRPVLLVEADPAGGTIRAGFFEGDLGVERGLHHLAEAHRAGRLAEAFENHLITLEEGRLLLPGLTDPLQAQGLVRTWEPLSAVFAGLESAGLDVLVDAGRVIQSAGQLAEEYPAAVVYRSDLVMMVAQSHLPSVAATRPVLASLTAARRQHAPAGLPPALLMLDNGPVTAGEAAQHLGLGGNMVLQLPWDEERAKVFSLGRGRRAPAPKRSPLMKAAAQVGQAMCNAVANARQQQPVQLPARRAVGLSPREVATALAQARGVSGG
ncbi:hypothetical protein BIV57_13395 [Mangrovactinospora gilvigrisea]|uniref:Chromosome partitioning protein n=1 Tax=Mangrovactinospora gilvigrisea TaxID=1428644 RepID=A0A1J7BE74_9ACTN|nr:hypothetical protein [Mangrovactinospora gilvigrisea]OIV36979.1 hypothetical protein BIV57_13395 [Mangrovactinospora gilvigrisea]